MRDTQKATNRKAVDREEEGKHGKRRVKTESGGDR